MFVCNFMIVTKKKMHFLFVFGGVKTRNGDILVSANEGLLHSASKVPENDLLVFFFFFFFFFFLISFMLFREIKRFLGEIETDYFTVSNNAIMTFGCSLFRTTFSSNAR